VKDLENQRARTIRTGSEPCLDLVRRLLSFKGIGSRSAWLFVMEVFAWRQIRNAREMGGIAGLTPTPYTSSQSSREQGISKAGNRRLRAMAVEIAWMWVHYQPESELTKWFLKRFGVGGRQRKIGIVAVARKILVLLWRFLQKDTVPPGVVREDWKAKMNGRRRPLETATAA
jgi:transposase